MDVALKIVSFKNCGSSKCGQLNPQPEANFAKNKAMKDGLQNYCKPCGRIQNRIWAKNNPEKQREKSRRLNAKWKIEKPDKIWESKRRSHLKANFGITLEQYFEMLKLQGHCCAICTRHESEFLKKLVVDHNHTTGKVRKLLCGQCNQLLGQAKENIKTLYASIKYLEDHSGY